MSMSLEQIQQDRIKDPDEQVMSRICKLYFSLYQQGFSETAISIPRTPEPGDDEPFCHLEFTVNNDVVDLELSTAIEDVSEDEVYYCLRRAENFIKMTLGMYIHQATKH